MARLTQQNKDFLDYFRSDPLHDHVAAYKKAYPKCKKLLSARVNASKLLDKPEAKAYLKKKSKKAQAAVDLKEEDILRDLMEVRDMCMGRKESAIVKITKDGDVVVANELNFNANGAGKALELLGKTKRMYTDKVAHEGVVQKVIYNFQFGGEQEEAN